MGLRGAAAAIPESGYNVRPLKGAFDVQGESACLPRGERGILDRRGRGGTARTLASGGAPARTPQRSGAGDLLLRGRPVRNGLEPGLGRVLRVRPRYRRELPRGR